MTFDPVQYNAKLGTSAMQDRRLIASLLQAGVIGANDLLVSPGGGMTSSVAAGAAVVPGSFQSGQGSYFTRNGGPIIVSHGTADPTNPRIDQVFLKVYDSTDGGDSSDSLPQPIIVPGTPTVGAALPGNIVGLGTPPTNALSLSYVLVPAGAGSLVGGDYQSTRVLAAPAIGVNALTTGLDANKPAAVPTNKGEIYQATDGAKSAAYLSDGSNIHTIYGARGSSIIATVESRTNTAYGALTTSDQVQNIVLPSDGLIAVWYQATWRETVLNTARASLFIGSNQLQVPVLASGTVVTQAAATGATASPGTNCVLASTAMGLASGTTGSSFVGDVTTGQALGLVGSGATSLQMEIGGSVNPIVGGGSVNLVPFGGACCIFAAAGTYTISVQFKASSGTVTALNRRLYAMALPFS